MFFPKYKNIKKLLTAVPRKFLSLFQKEFDEGADISLQLYVVQYQPRENYYDIS